MKKFLQKRLNNEKGLTLVELLAVIVILGIIAAIAIPSIGNIIQNSREKAVIADAQNVLAAANLYFIENSDATTASISGDDSLIPDFLDDKGTLESATVTKSLAEGGNTIDFSGKAGKETVSGNLTKAGLKNFDFDKVVAP